MSDESRELADLARSIPILMEARDLPPLRRVTKSKPRLVIQETVYHQSPSGQAVAVGRPISRDLNTSDHPYSRTVTVKESPSRVDMGWCLDLSADPPRTPSQLVVQNDEGQEQRQTIPTQEELAASAGRIVEVRVGTGHDSAAVCLVRPGMSSRFEPVPGVDYYVRCLSGEVTVTVTAFPG